MDYRPVDIPIIPLEFDDPPSDSSFAPCEGPYTHEVFGPRRK